VITLDLYLVDDDRWVPARAVLGDARSRPRLGASALSIEIGGTEYALDRWNLGCVELIGTQADDCVQRLRAGGPAILRSGVRDRQHVPFFLFEPPVTPHGSARVSQFFVDDAEAQDWSPLPGWGSSDPDVLFEWVAERRADLIAAAAAEAREVDLPELADVAVPFGQLVDELERLAGTVRAVVGKAAKLDRSD
jgi:hypothetical protein